MIAIARAARKPRQRSDWHGGFLAMMPAIALHAQQVFHYLDDEARAEAIQETVVRAMLAYCRLHERGRVNLAYPRVLARFAVAQFRDGRRVGERMNRREVLSPYARRMSGIRVESLHDFELPGGPWREALVEDKHAGPAETAAARIDVAEWFASMNRRNRKIAEALSQGFTTKDVARRFRVSPGRISQMRREFCTSWRAFQGEQKTKAEAEHGDSNWVTCNQAARMDNRRGYTTVIDTARLVV